MPEKIKTHGEQGSAEWITSEKLQSLGWGCKKSGPILGNVGWKHISERGGFTFVDTNYLRYEGDAMLLTIAATGAGKGRRVIWPNLRQYKGSVIIPDFKGEGAEKTAQLRESWGQDVIVIDPFHEVPDDKLPRRGRASFNPIDLVRKSGRRALEVALMIAESLIIPGEKEAYWGQQAQALLAAYIIFLAFDSMFDDNERNMRMLWKIARHPEHQIKSLVAMRLSSNDFVAEMAGMMLIEGFDEKSGQVTFEKNQSKEIKGIENSMSNGCLRIMHSQEIMSCLNETDVDFGKLRDGNMTVYLVLPFDHMETHGGFLRMLLTCALHQITMRGIEPHRPDGSRRLPVYMMLDEFVAMGRIDRIKRAAREMRGYNLKMHFFVQDLSSLKELYPQGWGSFLANSGAIQFFGGTSDNFTRDYLSRLTGQKTILNPTINETATEGETVGGGMGSLPGYSRGWTLSKNYAPAGRALLTPDEVGNLDSSEQLIVFSGMGSVLAKLVDDLVDFVEPSKEELRRRAATSFRMYKCRNVWCSQNVRVPICVLEARERPPIRCPKCKWPIDTLLEEFTAWATEKGYPQHQWYELLRQVIIKKNPTWNNAPAYDDGWLNVMDIYGVRQVFPFLLSGKPRPPRKGFWGR